MQNLAYPLSVLCLLILFLTAVLKKFRQPYLVAYILAGIIIGPHGFSVFEEPATIERLGELGVMLLMFFLGIEIEIPDSKSQLYIPVIAQVVRTMLSGLVAWIAGHALDWPLASILLFALLLTFNSTAVVSEFLKKHGELHSYHGKIVLNILLLQDILLAPVLSGFQLLGDHQTNSYRLGAALLGSLSMFFLLRAIRNRNLFQLPVFRDWQQDHEWQVFAAACICLGFGSLTALVGLTSAIGSFAAGIFIGRMGAFHWLGSVLQPFKVFFTALFFVSIGVMIDMSYLRQHIVLMLLITLLMLLVNSLLSALVFRLLRMPWRSSVYAGALLSQTGEFGLLACTLAYHLAIINEDVYKASLVITGLSLLLSTIWMGIVRRHIHRAVRPLHAA